MLTEKDYCDYKLVLELKEFGYDYIRREGLIHLYDAQKWLREEKRINIFVAQIPIKNSNNFHYVAYIQLGESAIMTPCSHTYEEVLLEGIKEAVKLLNK